MHHLRGATLVEPIGNEITKNGSTLVDRITGINRNCFIRAESRLSTSAPSTPTLWR